MFERIGRIALPPWVPYAAFATLFVGSTLLAAVWTPPGVPYVRVAFVGNSMQYYNDFPRFMEALSDRRITQNSCLHGDASLSSIAVTGNGMYAMWRMGSARVFNDDERVYDYGACTIPQLLFGYDDVLDQKVSEEGGGGGGGGNEDDDAELTDDFYSYHDGLNPCLMDEYYYSYLQMVLLRDGPPQFDYIVVNDNTRSPARLQSRQESLSVLESKYIPWFKESGATPIFLCTYGYSTPYRDMGGLSTVPEFTSYTYEGYRQYAALVGAALPDDQQPRIAPVGMAFLVVWEENFALWERLFHVDQIHASPLGTYLQGLVVHYTIFGRMPFQEAALRPDLSYLWMEARRFQPGEHRRSPFPTQEEAAYLYDVALRVMKHKYTPKSFTWYGDGEGADYTPFDDLFRIDDLF